MMFKTLNRCTPSGRPSRAFDFLQTGKPQKLLI